jgi:hypothetical protein
LLGNHEISFVAERMTTQLQCDFSEGLFCSLTVTDFEEGVPSLATRRGDTDLMTGCTQRTHANNFGQSFRTKKAGAQCACTNSMSSKAASEVTPRVPDKLELPPGYRQQCLPSYSPPAGNNNAPQLLLPHVDDVEVVPVKHQNKFRLQVCCTWSESTCTVKKYLFYADLERTIGKAPQVPSGADWSAARLGEAVVLSKAERGGQLRPCERHNNSCAGKASHSASTGLLVACTKGGVGLLAFLMCVACAPLASKSLGGGTA